MSRLLLHGEAVIPVVPQRQVLWNHSIAVENGKILEVGPREMMEEKYPGWEASDYTGHCILPGFIDCHGHTGHSMMKGLARAVTAYWNEIVWHICHFHSSPDFWYLDGLLSAADRLKSGVTSCLNILERGEGLDLYGEGQQHARAYKEAGVRATMSAGPGAYRYERIPKAESLEQWEKDYAATRALLEEFREDRLINVFVGPSTMVMSKQSRGRIVPEHCREFEEYDHMHLEKLSALAKEFATGVQANCCGNLVEMMARDPNAFLGPHVLLNHCHHMTMVELELMARTGTNVGRSPEASLAFCPYSEMLFRGINVVLTSDSTGVVSSYDQLRNTREIRMIEEFRQHGRRPDNWKLLESITIGAAKALLLEEQIGSLEPGKQADLITIDMGAPHLFRWQEDPVGRVMDGACGSDISNAYVAGNLVLDCGKVANIDEGEVTARASRVALEAVERGGLGCLWEPPAWGTVYRTFSDPVRLPLRTAAV